MPLNANLVWEVRPGLGAATGGGAFDAVSGTPGMDYSQQNTEQVTRVNFSVTNVNPSVVTSATYNFTAADVGNILNLTAGTNLTPGRRQIVSVAANAATLDMNTMTGAPADDVTGYLGGAVASIDTIYNVIVAGNKVYIKYNAAGDTLGGARTLTSGSVTSPILIEGYNSTRGDLASQSWSDSHDSYGFLRTTNYPTIVLAGNSLTAAGGTIFRCLVFTCSLNGVALTTGYGFCFRVKVTNTSTAGSGGAISVAARTSLVDCELNTTGSASSRSFYSSNGHNYLHSCRITSLAGNGAVINGSVFFSNCLFYDFAVAKAGVYQTANDALTVLVNCTFDRCAGNGISSVDTSQTTPAMILVNCQATNCGVWAANLRGTPVATQLIPIFAFNNRLRNNTTNYAGWHPSYSSGVGDILTAQTDAAEYASVANKDFHLLSASFGKSAGLPPYSDTGCWQRAEPTLPALNKVLVDTHYGDGGTELTGTMPGCLTLIAT